MTADPPTRSVLGRLTAALLILSGGCAPETGGDLASLDRLPALDLVEELRIGSLDDPDHGFTRIGSVEVTRGDTIYVAEAGDVEIRVYDPDGRLVRRIGKRGEGPGELRSVSRWGLIGDTVWVIDFTRTTLFRRDGSLISTVQIEPVQVSVAPYTATVRPERVRPDGTILGDLSSYGPVGSPDLPKRELRIPTVVWNTDGELTDTIRFATLALDPGSVPMKMVGSYPLSRQEYPVAYPLRWTDGEDSVRVERPAPESAEQGVLTVLRTGPAGDTLVRRELRYASVPVTGSYRDSVIEARMETLSRFAADPAEARAALEEMIHFAAFHPGVSRLAVMADGSLWLLRSPGSPEGWTWAVLQPDGTPRGTVTTPPGASILWSRDDIVYVQEQDELDVPWLVRYRLERD